MPLRAEPRVFLEWALRALATICLLWLLATSLTTAPQADPFFGSRDIISRLEEITATADPPAKIHADLDHAPGRLQVDWLRALAGSGSRVSWSGSLPLFAVSARPVAAPDGGWSVDIAGPAGSMIHLSDGASQIDSIRGTGGVAGMSIPTLSGIARARFGASVATSRATDSVDLRRVLILGRAGWESRFVVAALEEEGWETDLDISIAPAVSVRRSEYASIDTSRYSAVIALDEAASIRSREVVSYARSGGGVVLAPDAAAAPAFADIRLSVVPAPSTAIAGDGSVNSPEDLSFSPLNGLRPGAVVLQRRGRSPVVAAHRYFAGRVLQFGFHDSWRWRLTGDSLSPRQHRLWWSGLVSAVAYAPRTASASAHPEVVDNAPAVSVFDALGAPSMPDPHSLRSGGVSRFPTRPPDSRLLFAILSVCLLGEWLSRRLRGAR